MKSAVLPALAFALVLPFCLHAAIEPVCWFSDNMVIQRNKPIKVWGWAAKGEKITVSLNGKSAAATVDSDSRWEVTLDAMKKGGPFDMTLSGSQSGAKKISNILIGDVWVCAGQSNMHRDWYKKNNETVFGCDPDKAENLPNVRFFQVNNRPSASPVLDIKTSDNIHLAYTGDVIGSAPTAWWKAEIPKLYDFSRTGYHFARALHEALNGDVPLGFINVANGSSTVISWMSREMYHAVSKKGSANPGNTVRFVADPKAYPKQEPAANFNGVIHPMIGLGITGAIWWQGESDGDEDMRNEYGEYLMALIHDWRTRWGGERFPFLMVSLQSCQSTMFPNFRIIRDGTFRALASPNTGLAVIADVMSGVHPCNKGPAGYRLALCARKIFYGHDIVHQGPTFAGAIVQGNEIMCNFSSIGSGLVLKQSSGWKIKSASGSWANASARIEGSSIIVSGSVSNPEHVQYAYADAPALTLFNKEGLPASPFNSETFSKGMPKPPDIDGINPVANALYSIIYHPVDQNTATAAFFPAIYTLTGRQVKPANSGAQFYSAFGKLIAKKKLTTIITR